MIEEISPVNLVHVTLSEKYAKLRRLDHLLWRTTQNGDHWESLMGSSWETIDPPQEVIDEYKRLMNIL